MNSKETVKALLAAGWVVDRTTKHCIMKKDGKTVPIPMHGKKEIPIGTLKNIERITEAITKEEVEIAKGCPSLSVSLFVEVNPAAPETTATPAVDKGKDTKPVAGKKK